MKVLSFEEILCSLWIPVQHRTQVNHQVQQQLLGSCGTKRNGCYRCQSNNLLCRRKHEQASGWLTNLVMMSRVVAWGIWTCCGVSPCCASCFGIKCLWAISIFSSWVYPGKEEILFGNYSWSSHNTVLSKWIKCRFKRSRRAPKFQEFSNSWLKEGSKTAVSRTRTVNFSNKIKTKMPLASNKSFASMFGKNVYAYIY